MFAIIKDTKLIKGSKSQSKSCHIEIDNQQQKYLQQINVFRGQI